MLPHGLGAVEQGAIGGDPAGLLKVPVQLALGLIQIP